MVLTTGVCVVEEVSEDFEVVDSFELVVAAAGSLVEEVVCWASVSEVVGGAAVDVVEEVVEEGSVEVVDSAVEVVDVDEVDEVVEVVDSAVVVSAGAELDVGSVRSLSRLVAPAL